MMMVSSRMLSKTLQVNTSKMLIRIFLRILRQESDWLPKELSTIVIHSAGDQTRHSFTELLALGLSGLLILRISY